jgi:hypothetical protein
MVRALANLDVAEWMRKMHPLRLQYEIFSDANPIMAPVAALAEQARRHRRPCAAENPCLALQENASERIVSMLDSYREFSESMAERMFLSVYGAPTLQAALGIDPASSRPLRQAGRSPLQSELLRQRTAELKSRIAVGGAREAVIRGLIYVGLARASIDERGFEITRRIRERNGELDLQQFKALVREQFNMLLIDQEAALGAIPLLLPTDVETRREAFGVIKQVLEARGELSAEDKSRLGEVARLFGVEGEGGAIALPFRQSGEQFQARAS